MDSPLTQSSKGAELNEKGLWFAVACVAMIASYVGWQVFWFLTDDAFITFRYVSNSFAGHGYVWNAAPFRPVEGYTSFLWMVLLDIVWRVTGWAPPQTANGLGLIFGWGQLYFGYRIFARWRLSDEHAGHRVAYFLLILLAVLTNRTFLTWLSSGLETSFFNFFIMAWVYCALTRLEERGRFWPFGLALSTTLLALTRPDGLLFAGATVLLIIMRRPSLRTGLLSLPLLIIPLHLLWRHHFYGEWLPNTYFAKHIGGWWIESGWRYLASFVVEYGLWFMVGMVLLWAGKSRLKGLSYPAWIVVGTLLAEMGYYVFRIGGDHFEYRVLSYLILLCMLGFVWLQCHTFKSPQKIYAVSLVFLFLSWPIPWVHWQQTHEFKTREDTFTMKVSIAPHFPEFMQSWVAHWDEWQAWLIGHSVGVRHQEHKIFYEVQTSFWPERSEGEKIQADQFPLMSTFSVGVPAWVLPHVAILDDCGLNDYIIARNPTLRSDNKKAEGYQAERYMAHDRQPPPGYIECFQPNVTVEFRQATVHERPKPLTAADIQTCEKTAWY